MKHKLKEWQEYFNEIVDTNQFVPTHQTTNYVRIKASESVEPKFWGKEGKVTGKFKGEILVQFDSAVWEDGDTNHKVNHMFNTSEVEFIKGLGE